MTKSMTIISSAMLMLMLAFDTVADTGEPAHTGGPSESTQLPDPLQAGWKGNATCEMLFENEINRALRCTFPPGVGHERHYHLPHFGYALSGGKMRLTDANGIRDIDLATGTSYFSEGVVWHEGLNIGTTTVQYLIVEQK